METSDLFAEPIDKSKIPPLHQKRIVAFINHFLLSSCKFLNEFVGRCDERFIIVERKMQKLEVALNILEAKLASIPGLHSEGKTTEVATPKTEETPIGTSANDEPTKPNEKREQETDATTTETAQSDREAVGTGVKACDDVRYKKFFKMVQFGVPSEAVKIKMQAEGIPPEILDTPNLLLADGVRA